MAIRLGLVGFGSVGKDTLARYLIVRYGFVHVSCGDLIRQYSREHGNGEMTRSALQRVGNELRIQYGPDYLVRKALETPHERLVISGLRAVAEAATLKAAGGTIIAITAPLETRYGGQCAAVVTVNIFLLKNSAMSKCRKQ
jgi:dephospho-CoA kinase